MTLRGSEGRVGLVYLLKKRFFLFICLAVPAFSCGMWDLAS